jgi:23S rRNA pseudouridine1911/1915/1917 synthase
VVEPQGWVVPTALQGERLDRALALLTGLSRREVSEMIADGRVSCDSEVELSRSRRVASGELLFIDTGADAGKGSDLIGDPRVEVKVIWNDAELLVVDKAAGMVVHPGPGHRYATLVHGLLARFPDLAALKDEPGQASRPGIVHRLDKGTSGLLVVARTPRALDSLGRQLRDRSLRREYLALVAGRVESDAGLVDAPLARSERDRTLTQVRVGGRPARTHYRVLERFDRPAPATLVRCRLETGRTHQVRVHLAAIGHPVVGDTRYGWKPAENWRPLPPGRPFLHAEALELNHPVTADRLRFFSDLHPDLDAVLQELRASGRAR